MSRLHSSFLACVALIASLSLVACGGSGDDSTASTKMDDRLTPFLGHWVACWATSANTTEKDDLRVTPAGPNQVSITRVYNQYTGSTNCTGPATLLIEEQSVLTLKRETISVAGVTLEKFDRTGQVTTYQYNAQGVPSKTIAPAAPQATGGLVSGTPITLRVGDDTQLLDPQGNPTVLSPLEYLKQP